jgi:hypothetical protein
MYHASTQCHVRSQLSIPGMGGAVWCAQCVCVCADACAADTEKGDLSLPLLCGSMPKTNNADYYGQKYKQISENYLIYDGARVSG